MYSTFKRLIMEYINSWFESSKEFLFYVSLLPSGGGQNNESFASGVDSVFRVRMGASYKSDCYILYCLQLMTIGFSTELKQFRVFLVSMSCLQLVSVYSNYSRDLLV